jgi:hypothetical protein
MPPLIRRSVNWTRRITESVFDGIGFRPLGIIVFTASVVLLLYLSNLNAGTTRSQAVANAQLVDHPARVASFVTHVFVKPGDRVEVGAPLVELSSYFIDQRLERLDVQIEQVINESKLAQARLIVREQRWVDPGVRIRPDKPSLQSPTEALYSKEIEVLQTRRRFLLEDRENLTVLSSFTGIVAAVSWQGRSIGEGKSVASIRPEYADEIVAYVPAATDPATITEGAKAYISQPSSAACRRPAVVLRRGAAVAEAPAQLNGFLRLPLHGLPVHISVPDECQLGVGQVLTVEFLRSVS